MKSQSVSKTVSKTMGNTPIRAKATPAQLVAFSKVSTEDQNAIKTAVKAMALSNGQNSTAKPTKNLFTLVAGTVRKLSPKLAASIKRQHVDKLETLRVTPDGHELTHAGVFHLSKRLDAHKIEAQEIGAWMYNNGKLPSAPGCAAWENKNFGPTNLLPGMQFPNIIHWGGFSSMEMRLAFALIWAK